MTLVSGISCRLYVGVIHRCQLLKFERSSYNFTSYATQLFFDHHMLLFRNMYFPQILHKKVICCTNSLVLSTFVDLSSNKLLLKFDFLHAWYELRRIHKFIDCTFLVVYQILAFAKVAIYGYPTASDVCNSSTERVT